MNVNDLLHQVLVPDESEWQSAPHALLFGDEYDCPTRINDWRGVTEINVPTLDVFEYILRKITEHGWAEKPYTCGVKRLLCGIVFDCEPAVAVVIHIKELQSWAFVILVKKKKQSQS